MAKKVNLTLGELNEYIDKKVNEAVNRKLNESALKNKRPINEGVVKFVKTVKPQGKFIIKGFSPEEVQTSESQNEMMRIEIVNNISGVKPEQESQIAQAVIPQISNEGLTKSEKIVLYKNKNVEIKQQLVISVPSGVNVQYVQSEGKKKNKGTLNEAVSDSFNIDLNALPDVGDGQKVLRIADNLIPAQVVSTKGTRCMVTWEITVGGITDEKPIEGVKDQIRPIVKDGILQNPKKLEAVIPQGGTEKRQVTQKVTIQAPANVQVVYKGNVINKK
jgi:hypothetical protein